VPQLGSDPPQTDKVLTPLDNPRATAPAGRRTGSSSRTRPHRRSGVRRRKIGEDERRHR